MVTGSRMVQGLGGDVLPESESHDFLLFMEVYIDAFIGFYWVLLGSYWVFLGLFD